MRSHVRLVAAAITAAGAVPTMVLADGGDDRKGECIISRVTPPFDFGGVGEHGDMLGVMAVSDDGRHVAVTSYANFFAPNPEKIQGHLRQIYVIDRETNVGELISIAHDADPGKGDSIGANASATWFLAMSRNARYVAWVSDATNLVEQPMSGEFLQVYVRDRLEGVTHLVSVSNEGEVGHGWSGLYRVGVSNNGRVVFTSRATNLAEDHPTAPSAMWQVYVRDIHAGTTTLISRDERGNPAYIDASHPAISADGNVVSFMSSAALTSNINHFTWNIFARDLTTSTIELVSVDNDGIDRAGWGDYSHLSDDGNSVVFRFGAFNGLLDPTMPQDNIDCIYVRNRSAGTTTGVNRSWENGPATISPEIGFTISGDGKHVAWETIDQMTPEPINPIWHVYRTNVETLEIDLVTKQKDCKPIPKMHDQMWSAISGDGLHVAFISMWNVMQDDAYDWQHGIYMWSDPDAGTTPPCALADLNCDGSVGVADLLMLLANWGDCPDGSAGCAGDLDASGSVGVSDLLILLANWG